MTAKEHYDHHLAIVYPWMAGDFETKTTEEELLFRKLGILPGNNLIAIDLGCGHGIQAISLARLGFTVKAVDFNSRLLNELTKNNSAKNVEVAEDDIIHFLHSTNAKAGLIVCMGDTITHLPRHPDVHEMVQLVFDRLDFGGKFVISFRDLTNELKDEQRFIPVKSDESRIATCFLEYFPDHVIVHDLLFEKTAGGWVQKISSYPKLRIGESAMLQLLTNAGFRCLSADTSNGLTTIISEK